MKTINRVENSMHASIKWLSLTFVILLWATMVQAGIPKTSPSEISYYAGIASVDAHEASLFGLLGALAGKSEIGVFVSEDLKDTRVTLQTPDLPLEAVLKRLLRPYNYALVYQGNDEQRRIVELKVFPKGKYTGPLQSIAPTSAPSIVTGKDREMVMVSSGREIVIYGGLADHGLLLPSWSEPGAGHAAEQVANSRQFKVQKQLEASEMTAYQNLMLQKQRIDSVEDPGKKEALIMAYAQEVDAFYDLKKANLNKVEALKRIDIFTNMQKAAQNN